jgi:hypothetical protein
MTWRFWLTSSFAAVLAAVAQGAVAAGNGDATNNWRSSRHSVGRTAERLKDCAREQGLRLFATLPAGADRRTRPAMLIVLGCAADQTPAAQSLVDGAIELPLTLSVVARSDGGADVRFVDARWIDAHPDAPHDVQAMVRKVERIVDAALG